MSIKTTPTLAKLTDRCDVAYAISLIGGKWKVSIIWDLAKHGQSRLSSIRRQLSDISEGVLITQLKELERDQIVRRIDFKEVPPHVEYALTSRGQRLITTIKSLEAWGNECRTNRTV